MHFFGPEQIAATRRAYYAMISQVDYSLGRLFGCLRENIVKFADSCYTYPIDEKEG